jgi:uncharacterized protein (TIGR00645 family)
LRHEPADVTFGSAQERAGVRHLKIETLLEATMFRSRWILAPFYVGLALSLFLLLFKFTVELVEAFATIASMTTDEATLAILSLIDISLAANLVLIVVFSGYENFVSKIDTGDNEDRPHWMGTLDFSGLKMKLIGSIVAISAISLLRTFMSVAEPHSDIEQQRLMWLVVLHLTFVVSGVLFALMDWVHSLHKEKAAAVEALSK